MTGRIPLAVVCCVLAAPCVAQTAAIEVSHDHPTGFMEPGETVRITATLTWSGALMAGRIVGDLRAAPDAGTAANATGPFDPGLLINYGNPVAGSVRGVDLGAPLPFSIPVHPAWFRSDGLEFLHYMWTAPQSPGPVAFDWQPDPAFPDVLFFETPTSFMHTPLPTTYIGTSLTVVPAPPGGACLAIALGAAAFRRRR